MSDVMQFCPNCGTKLPEGANVCPQCGSPLNSTQQSAENTTLINNSPFVQPQPVQNPQPVYVEAPKSKNNNILIIAIVIGAIGLIGLGIGIYALLSKEDSKTVIEYVEAEEEHEKIAPAPTSQTAFEKAFDKVYHNELVDHADIINLSQDELRILRNLPFAKHGRRFKSPELQRYFARFDWYTPLFSDVSMNSLTANDRKNINFIQLYER